MKIPAIYSFILGNNDKDFFLTHNFSEKVDMFIPDVADFYLLDDELNFVEDLEVIFKLLIEYD